MKNSSHTSNKTSFIASRMSVIFSATFISILFLLHFLKPELDPSWRMISEYEIGRYGWLMRLAFFCWGSSVLSLLVALRGSLRTISGKVGYVWLVLIGIALFGAGIFATNAITDTTPSTTNSLHTLCGAFVILTFPIASSLVVGSLRRNGEWNTTRRHLFWVETLVWLSMFMYFGAIIVSNAINPSAGRVGPEVYIGWPNRFMVVVYNVWLIIVATNAKKLSSGS
jgi:hypothetical protein